MLDKDDVLRFQEPGPLKLYTLDESRRKATYIKSSILLKPNRCLKKGERFRVRILKFAENTSRKFSIGMVTYSYGNMSDPHDLCDTYFPITFETHYIEQKVSSSTPMNSSQIFQNSFSIPNQGIFGSSTNQKTESPFPLATSLKTASGVRISVRKDEDLSTVNYPLAAGFVFSVFRENNGDVHLELNGEDLGVAYHDVPANVLGYFELNSCASIVELV